MTGYAPIPVGCVVLHTEFWYDENGNTRREVERYVLIRKENSGGLGHFICYSPTGGLRRFLRSEIRPKREPMNTAKE